MSLISDDLAIRIAKDYEGKVLAGCEIQSLHRSGGTSVILLGAKGEEFFAIKIYAKELFDDSGAELERINRQVEKKNLHHHNLVRTHEAGLCPEHGYHYLVMDFINDPTITEKVNELTQLQIRSVIQQTASAALFMHETMKLVHRDIKPDNIAIRNTDDHVTLLDLGLVRPIAGITVTDQGSQHIKGTKRYAPPELLDNTVLLDEDGWLAVTYYQLGATLYEMLTRKQPFAEFQGNELLHAIRHTTLTIEQSASPPDLVKLALDCLTKDPSKRRSLVSWDRFLNPPEFNTEVDELSDLIASLPKATVNPSKFPNGAQEQQQLKKSLFEISNDVEMSIRSFLAGKERLFPNYAISRWGDVESNSNAVFLIETVFSELATPTHVYSVIAIEITDASSRSCDCKMFTSITPPVAPIDLTTFRTVYRGAFVLMQFRTTIGNELARDLKDVLSKSNEL